MLHPQISQKTFRMLYFVIKGQADIERNLFSERELHSQVVDQAIYIHDIMDG